jgi:hypothetical protein
VPDQYYPNEQGSSADERHSQSTDTLRVQQFNKAQFEFADFLFLRPGNAPLRADVQESCRKPENYLIEDDPR